MIAIIASGMETIEEYSKKWQLRADNSKMEIEDMEKRLSKMFFDIDTPKSKEMENLEYCCEEAIKRMKRQQRRANKYRAIKKVSADDVGRWVTRIKNEYNENNYQIWHIKKPMSTGGQKSNILQLMHQTGRKELDINIDKLKENFCWVN